MSGCPGKRGLDDRRVLLVLDLLRHSSFGCVLVHTVRPDPAQHDVLGQLAVRREVSRISRRQRAGRVDRARVIAILPVTAPAHRDNRFRRISRSRGGVHPFNNPGHVIFLRVVLRERGGIEFLPAATAQETKRPSVDTLAFHLH